MFENILFDSIPMLPKCSHRKRFLLIAVTVLYCFHYSFFVLCVNSGIKRDQIESKLKEEDIFPEIVQTIPHHIVEISYSGRFIRFGELLKNESFTRNQPTRVTWPYDRKELYLILMTDLDGPTWTRPEQNEWHHWLIGNIFANDFEDGEILSQYIGPIPGQGSLVHTESNGVLRTYEPLRVINLDNRHHTRRSEAYGPLWTIFTGPLFCLIVLEIILFFSAICTRKIPGKSQEFCFSSTTVRNHPYDSM